MVYNVTTALGFRRRLEEALKYNNFQVGYQEKKSILIISKTFQGDFVLLKNLSVRK